ncbi:MAG: hypothetical protein M1433_00745 [Candidatus Parvarchaeota archaeon]|nr:hypothetical protein [Candidatus Parvarchaeota archaeon]
MTFQEDEQKLHEVSNKLDRIRGNSWKKFKGDTINRLIISLLRPYVKNYKISGPNAFIEGCPTEFDILIVNTTAEPINEYSNCYKKEDVKLAIEVLPCLRKFIVSGSRSR